MQKKATAVFWALHYQIDVQEYLGVIDCESSWNIAAVGDSGRAYSLLQFHAPTFEGFKEEAEMTDLEYDSWKDQLRLGAWGFANDKEHHWTCWKLLTPS